jgi:23S rRNA-intervening sequence protein
VEGFRGLEVYRRAVALADKLYPAAVGWPPFDRWTTGVQMVRAADSIGANIAEGDGRFGSADQKALALHCPRFRVRARALAREAETRNLNVPPDPIREAGEIARMLNGLIRRMPQH